MSTETAADPRSDVKSVIRAWLPRTIRPRRILAGPLRGAWLVTSWHDYPAGLTGRTERPLLDWFAGQVRPGETWLDVGAHYGYTAFALARLVGPAGRVFTFEPVPATAGCVDQGRALNRLGQVTVVPLGLGSVETLEFRQLALTRGMADSTLHLGRVPPFDVAQGAPSASRGARRGPEDVGRVPRSGPGASSSVNIGIARFDWLWPAINGGSDAIHGVKIDVQGMELETLGGMRDALARWRPRLVLELHAGVSREAVLSLLRELGYSSEAVAIEPVRGERTPQFLDNHSYAFHAA
jgi:FkbM family methyltransferase